MLLEHGVRTKAKKECGCVDCIEKKQEAEFRIGLACTHRRDRIVVSTLRCGCNNPGSNPGHGTWKFFEREMISVLIR